MSEQPFFTGLSGAEHDQMIAEGSDYIVFHLCNEDLAVIEDPGPEKLNKMLNLLDWEEWLRVRTKSEESALLIYWKYKME
jgi:hypothetical protein